MSIPNHRKTGYREIRVGDHVGTGRLTRDVCVGGGGGRDMSEKKIR